MDRFILIGGLFVCFVLISLGVVSAQQVIEIDSCGVLNISGATYVLTQDVSSTGTCFTIGEDNVTLDGGGFLVNYSQSAEGYGVDNSGGFDGVVVKNLVLEQEQSDFSSKGIYFEGASGGTVDGNMITTFGEAAFAIQLLDSDSISVGSNTVTTYGVLGYGILVFGGSGFSVYGNAVVTSGRDGHGIFLSESSGSSVRNNIATVSGVAGDGFVISTNSNTEVEENIISVSGASGYGIVLLANSGTNVMSNVITASGSGGRGISFSSGSGEDIKGNEVTTIGSSGSYGIYLTQALNSNIENNTVSTSGGGGSPGVFLSESSSNTVQNNNLDVVGSEAFTITGDLTEDNVFTSNVIVDNGQLELNVVSSGVDGVELIDQGIRDYFFMGNLIMFKENDFGEIEFLDPISGSGESLSDDVQIGFNSVMVDSNSNPGLNSRARVSLFGNPGEGFDNPVILRDGLECPVSVCTPLTPLNVETVVFEVESWDGSEYSIGEGGEVVCGDSDGGLVPTVFGVACIGGVCEEDFCSGKYELREYTCRSESVISSRTYACANECNAGACKVERRRSFQILSRLSAKELVFPFFAVYNLGVFSGLVFFVGNEDGGDGGVLLSSNVSG